MLKPADIEAIRKQMSPLCFDSERDRVHPSAALECYLDHFQIHFGRSMPHVRHCFGSFEVDGFTIATHYWLPDAARGTVFVCHGYYDHVGLYGHLIRFALQNQYAVVAYDLPGMGLSSGEPAAIGSFRSYYRVLRRCLAAFHGRLPEPWFAVGQSAGATPLLRYVLQHGAQPFGKIILLAPLIRSRGWSCRDRWLHLCLSPFVRRLPRVFTHNSHDGTFVDFLKTSDPLQARHLSVRWVGAMKEWIRDFERFEPRPDPVLVIQGTGDQTVDWRYNLRQIKTKLPNARTRIISGARHHLVAESAPYRAQVFAAIKTYLEKKRREEAA